LNNKSTTNENKKFESVTDPEVWNGGAEGYGVGSDKVAVPLENALNPKITHFWCKLFTFFKMHPDNMEAAALPPFFPSLSLQSATGSSLLTCTT